MWCFFVNNIDLYVCYIKFHWSTTHVDSRSSFNVSTRVAWSVTIQLSTKSFMNIKKRYGPRIDHCGTPALIVLQCEKQPSGFTLGFLCHG